MMRMMVALTLLALAACEDGTPESDRTSIKVTSDYIGGLQALSEPSRNLAMLRAIRDSGSACKRVDGSGYQEDYKNMSMWTARCSDSGDWAVFIAANGDIQVRQCSDSVQLGLPQCRFAARPAG